MQALSLKDLVSVGKETIKDLHLLDITTVEQLKGKDPHTLYDKLCQLTGVKHDICVLDVLSTAVAQAENPNLPANQKPWWYWSRKRKKQM